MNESQKLQLEALVKYLKKKKVTLNSISLNYNDISTENQKRLRFRTLIHLVLSARAKDTTVLKTMDELDKASKGLTPEWLSKANPDLVLTIISHIPSFHKKGSYIKKIAEICAFNYDGDIPQTYEELLALPGVGIKSATIAMEMCWNKSVGVGVDTHVHRVANRIGFVKTKTAEQTEEKLQEIIPSDKWADLSNALYILGQETCTSRKPKCDECPLEDCDYKA